MFFRLIAALALLWPAYGQARCAGNDLISALPAAELAELADRAAAVPHGSGLLWQATRGDRRLVIFGTYHLRHAQTEAHVAAMAPHMQAADVLWFESNSADQAQLQADIARDPSIMFITEGPSMPDLLGDDLWPVYAQELQARGFPGFMAAKMKPMMGAMMLGIGPCMAQAGALTEAGIDKILAQQADATGKDSRSLEDPASVLRLMDHFAATDQLRMVELSLGYAHLADDLHHTLLQRYLASEIALLWEFTRDLSIELGDARAAEDFATFETLLLEQRNRAWVDLLDADSGGQTALVAVGAGHLPYDFGLLSLLEQRGWSISALPFP